MKLSLEDIAQRLILVVFLISLLSALGASQYDKGPEWWNDDWSHKKIYEIQADSTIKNYPVKVNIDTQSMINKGIMESDCSDLRIAWQDNQKLPTEIVSGCNTGSTTVAFLTKNETFSPGTYNFYVYTGNPSASLTGDKADIEAAFDDDWDQYGSGNSLDSLSNLWAGGATTSNRDWSGSRGMNIDCGPSRSCGFYLDLEEEFDITNGGIKGDFFFDYYWWETTDNAGHGFDAVACDSNTAIVGSGGNNPQYSYRLDANAYNNDNFDYRDNGDYQTWHRSEADVDWDNKFGDFYTVGYGNANDGATGNWNGNYEICEFGGWAYENFYFDEQDINFNAVSLTERGGLVNVFGRIRDDAGNPVSGVEITPVEEGTTNDLTSNTGEMCLEDGVTQPNGKFECAVDHSRVFDLNTPAGKIVEDIEFGQISESDWLNNSKHHLDDTAYFDYRMYEGDHSFYEDLTFSIVNQTNSHFVDEEMDIFQAGTDNIVFETTGNYPGSTLTAALDQREVYDMKVFTDFYQHQFVFRNIRVPDLIEAGYNQNFIPESTMSNSLKFSAGQTLPAQTLITRPFSDFDVVNVSIEKQLDPSYSLVSDVLVRKFNVNFDAGWQDWSNRKTVSVQEVYNRDWDDSGSEMNDAWGVITFNPEGFQNNDCSDVRLTDKNNNIQDFTINTCQDDYVEMEFNSEMDQLEEKEFYVYYGNSGASDAQTAVQRPNEYTPVSFDTGSTGLTDTYFYNDNQGGFKSLNYSIPQNIEFIQRTLTVSGNRSDPRQNNMPVNLDTDYQDFSGVEIEPTRPYILEGVQIQLANTTVDTQFVVRNQSSGNNIIVRDVPNNDAGEYYVNLTNQSVIRQDDNEELLPNQRYLMFVRYGEARRASGTETQRPMFNLDDTIVHRQLFGLDTDGSSGSDGDYPTLVSRIDTVDPELPTNVTIVHENTGTTVYNGPDQLNDPEVVDLTGVLDSVEWRRGDPLDDPKLHEFNITSDTDGELVIDSDTQIEFEHPVTTVSKSASACSVNPQSPSYFHVDRSDCSYLNRVNISEGQWFRLDYRFRTPGPNDFDAPGDVNSYNISDTMVRFDILQETEEFTTG